MKNEKTKWCKAQAGVIIIQQNKKQKTQVEEKMERKKGLLVRIGKQRIKTRDKNLPDII